MTLSPHLALLVGIDRYPSFPEASQLRGCTNDVRLVSHVLRERFGFPDSGVATLCDGEATRAAILHALDGLSAADPDACVVVHFSGHGSRVLDQGGDESDMMDETLVPYDAGGSVGRRDILDDELVERLLSLRARSVTVVLDACHSGGAFRGEWRVRGVGGGVRAEGLPAGGAGRRLREAAAQGLVTIAACREDELARELRPGGDEGPHGALSWLLCSAALALGPGATHAQVMQRVAAGARALGGHQQPLLAGDVGRALFGASRQAMRRTVPILGRAVNRVTLGAGAAHGLSPTARLDVLETGEGGRRTTVGAIRIETVRALTAVATVEEEARPGAVTGGTEALATADALGELRATVRLPEEGVPGAEQLRRAVTASPLLRIAAPGGDPGDALRVVPVRGGLRVIDGAEAVLAEATDPDPEAAAAGLCARLEDAVLARLAIALENPDETSALRGSVGMRLLRRRGGAWVEATPGPEGLPAFAEGDALAIEIWSTHAAPIWLNVLDFGVTGVVSQVYPVLNAEEALPAFGGLRIGTEPDDQLELFLPPRRDGAPLAQGTETLKVFATTAPTELRLLLPGGARGAIPSSSVGGLLQRLLGRRGAGAQGGGAAGDEDWTTVSMSFRVTKS